MLLDESTSIEIVTTLRKHSLTASVDSKWWEFSVSSENKGTWTKHCWGLVTDGYAVALPTHLGVAPLARKADSKPWYQTLSRVGLNYSNRFIGVENITASPVDTSASVRISDYRRMASCTRFTHPPWISSYSRGLSQPRKASTESWTRYSFPHSSSNSTLALVEARRRFVFVPLPASLL